jgi:MFS family permease
MKKRNNNKDRIKKSLWYSILDGTFCSMMIGFGESFLSAFAVFLNATNFQLGLLGSLPPALGSISQLWSNKLIKLFNYSRKRLVYTGAFFQGLMYLAFMLVFFLGELRVFHLIIFASIYWIFGMILGPAWSSWMGDLVEENKRGTYFGRRNKMAGFATFASFMLGGYILQQFADKDMQYIGFVVIFSLALASRIISFIYLTKKYEPKFRIIRAAEFTFIDFLKQARFRNYGLFALYLCFMNFAVFLAGPYFIAYMLHDLKMNYLSFTIVTATALIVRFLSMPLWGRASDRYGNKRILSFSGFLMPLTPVLWLFSTNILYIIFIQIFAGFIWAGFEIASFNFIFDTTSPQKRTTCIAYYNVLNGVAIFLGAVLGSIIIKYNQLFWSSYLLVFLLSGILRYFASFIFIPKLREVRKVEYIEYPRLFFTIITNVPVLGMIHNFVMFIKKHNRYYKL